jgi:hypothetical protein
MRKIIPILTVLIAVSFSLSAQITTSSEWIWVKDDSTVNRLGNYLSEYKPGCRSGGISWKDNSGNFLLFGGFGYLDTLHPLTGYGSLGPVNNILKYVVSTNTWISVRGGSLYIHPTYGTQGVTAITNDPGSRYNSTGSGDASGNLWLFGGMCVGGGDYYDDLWKYDPLINRWTWMKGDNTIEMPGLYGVQGVSTINSNPKSRIACVSWEDPQGNFWLFGGNNSALPGSGEFNDLWKYNPATNMWTWMRGDSTANHIGIYGTQGVASNTNQPGARSGSMTWTDASGNLWLFGGYLSFNPPTGAFNDLWKYDPATNMWTWMKGDSTQNHIGIYGTQGVASLSNQPGSRIYGMTWTDATGNLWLFGGSENIYSSSALLNDLWKYDPSSNMWTWIKGDNINNQYGIYGTLGVPDFANKPGSRSLSGHWTDNSGNIWLFGGNGYAASAKGYLNDLWTLSANSVLPVTITNIRAYELNNKINVEWTLSQEINMSSYEIEKSITGVNFSKGGTVASSGNHSSAITYNWFDANPNQGANFYRIKMIGKDGKESYSQIVKVVIGKGSSISIYPNPVVSNSFALQFNDEPKGNYNVRIMNSAGQVVYKNVINHNGGSGTQTIQLPMLLAKGIYSLEVADPSGNKNIERLMVDGK